ncbi:MAG: ATP-binding protein [Planctomycetes bacterium]|nr:ATP-binding protein [Planctomycetota bacterium]
MSRTDPFWTEPTESTYGAWHQADRDTKTYRPGILFVFVHGVRADRWTWHDLPAALLAKLGIDVDVLSFEFPAKVRHKASIWTAAADLAKRLSSGENRAYPHLVFVTHSTGGLVVKKMLADDIAATLKELKAGDKDLEQSASIALRTRRVVNVAVPHRGGDALKSWLGGQLYTRAVYPGVWCLKQLRTLGGCKPQRGERPLGRNKIIRQLRYGNPDLLRLEVAYRRAVRNLRAGRLPVPLAVEIIGRDDDILPTAPPPDERADSGPGADRSKRYVLKPDSDGPDYARAVRRSLRAKVHVLRGEHSSVKLVGTKPRGLLGRLLGWVGIGSAARERVNLIVDILADELGWARDPAAAAVALVTVARTFNFDRVNKITQLFDDPDRVPDGAADRADPRRTIPVSGTDQAGAVQWMRKIVVQGDQALRTVLVSGDAGVGKSSAVRWFARELALRFLAPEPDKADPLAVLVPMQQITLDDAQERAFPVRPWCVLREAISRAANQYTAEHAAHLAPEGAGGTAPAEDEGGKAPARIFPDIGADWLAARLARPTVLILDGIDDFLTKHPRIELAHFIQMLDDLTREHGTNRRLTLLLGARSSQPGLLDLVPNHGDIVEILRLSLTQAERFFPGAGAVLSGVKSHRLNHLLLTPLILSEIGPKIAQIPAASLRTRSGIMEEALKAIFDKRDIPRGKGADGSPFLIDAWLDAAMLVAWRFYQGFRGEMSRRLVREEVAKHEEQFREHFALHPGVDRGTIEQGFEIIRTDAHFARLLRGTVFFPTGRTTFRFMHREWEEFLVGRFIATCLRARKIDDPGAQSLTKNVFEYAGEQWYDPERHAGRVAVDGALLKAVLYLTAGRPGEDGKPTQPPNQYVAGCFVGTLGNSIAPLPRAVVQALLDRTFEIEELARHTMLNTLTFRCLRAQGREDAGEPPDPSADDIRRALAPVLVEYLRHDRRETNAVTRSLAWCNLRALRALYPDSPEPPGPWLGLGLEEEADSLRMLCPWRPQGWTDPHAPGDAAPLARAMYRPDRKQASVQTAYFRIQTIVLEQDHNPITTVHHMYALATALRNGGAIDEVGRPKTGIAVMLVPDSEITRKIEEYARQMGLSQLMEIWEHCRWACGPEGRAATPVPPPDQAGGTGVR